MNPGLVKTVVLGALLFFYGEAVFCQPVHVYLFGGQSNQQGLGENKEIAEDQRECLARARFWSGEAFVKIHPGQTQTSAVQGRFGPEIGFAIAHANSDSDHQIAIIKHSTSGIALSAGWDNQAWHDESPAPSRLNFYPGKSHDDPNQGTAYIKMIERFKSGLKHLDEQGVEYEIRGVVWVQGEQDSKHQVSASSYARNLSRLIDRLHQDLGISEQRPPFLFAHSLGMPPSGIVPGTGKAGDKPNRFVHRELLRQVMEHADADSGHVDAIPNAYLISTDGLPLKDDVHYNTEGQLELGRRFYAAFQNNCEKKSKN